MNIVPFPSRAELNARERLDALVARARKLQVFGPTVDFDAPVWDLTSVKVAVPTAVSRRAGRIYFTTADNGTSKGLEDRTLMLPAFAELIKAIVVLDEFAKPKTPMQHRAIVRASRPLHDALANRAYDPVELISADFHNAARWFVNVASVNTAYSMGTKLGLIADAVNRYQVSKVRIAYTNPNPRVEDELRLIDDEARARGAKKMASDEEIDAIIEMSLRVREIGEDPDVIHAAAAELLMCAPWRINEALGLLVDCERRDANENGEPRLGLAYGGSKGFEPSIKWIPTAMRPIAERALADIRRISEPSRQVAKFMEEHPGRAWLPEPWRLANPETRATTGDLAAMIGLSSTVAALQWAKGKGIPVVERCGFQGLFRLSDIESAILKMQPKLPPGSPPLSSYLFLIPLRFNSTRNEQNRMSVVGFVTDGSVRDFLVGRLPGRSVFERLKICDAGGKPYSVRSHKFRHFHNTRAQEGRLSQLDIARWSGRKDMTQNAVYDHTGGMPLARTMREMLKSDAMKGPIAETFAALPAVDREDFLKSRLSTAHLTEIGMCIQDWSLAPCPNHGACAGCGDHLVIKGDPKRKDAAKKLLEAHEHMLADAQAEASDGTFGASNWVEHNSKLVDGLRRIVAVHEDNTIPDGRPVQVV
jgi:hypothetical protein